MGDYNICFIVLSIFGFFISKGDAMQLMIRSGDCAINSSIGSFLSSLFLSNQASSQIVNPIFLSLNSRHLISFPGVK